MAAQKLTKGRFVQIIIMLTLLIVAFFWRTFNYQNVKNVNCDLNSICKVEVNDSVFEVKVVGEKIAISSENELWEIKGEGISSQSPNKWEIPFNSKHSLEFINKSSDQVYLTELVFE
ncbi:hypothetical protein EGH82_07655 [Vibrio ponticus]|uniref:Uncharacterized protein n=1 Tax=Vibrio ponticus TaxID=265668 RepID=A0A3N3E1Y8_9VIBR|nr:hypothetical protein [Vibrio ponticus]ROV60757.1 hypothetical protein EGH82_07655 [Vibrio ponticus]